MSLGLAQGGRGRGSGRGATSARGGESRGAGRSASPAARDAPPVAPPAAAARVANKRRRSEPPSRAESVATSATVDVHEPAPVDLGSEEDLEAYFALLQGESSNGADGLVTAEQIRRMCRDLQLDVERSFTAERLELMVECFDQGGKGALSLGDFRAIMRMVARGS